MAKSSFFSGTGTTPTNVESVASSKAAAEASENAAAASAAAAAQSATQAETSNTDSNTAKVAAQAAQAAAETAETNSAASAASAATSLAGIGNSETNAATSASESAASAAAAAVSASSASSSATSAASDAASAATSLSNIGSAEANAAASATSAASSASSASTDAASASASQVAAAASEAAAATSEANSATSETNAATSASQAATSAANSATSETNAATSASSASTSASNAASSASAASASQVAAAASAASAANAYDTFDDRYLGSKTADPTVDNDGNALVQGSLYFNSTANEMRVYDGGSWIAASSAGGASLLEYKYTATAAQTTFSGADDNANTLSYTQDNLIVTLNGVVLENGADYTATTGTSVVLASGAAANDELNVIAFKSFTTADMVSSANGGTFYNNIDVQGTVTADGLTSSAVITAQEGRSNTAGTGQIVIDPDDTTVSAAFRLDQADNKLNIDMTNAGTWQKKLSVYTNGDISFYEDTGTTAKFFWDASAESLGIGTSSPNGTLTVRNDSTNTEQLILGNSLNTGGRDWRLGRDNAASGDFIIKYSDATNNNVTTEAMRIDNSGNVGIGISSPSTTLHVYDQGAGGDGTVHIGGTTSNATGQLFYEVSGSTYLRLRNTYRSTNSNAYMEFDAGYHRFLTGTGGSETMRITSGGQLLLGTTSGTVYYNSVNAYNASAVIKTNATNEIADLVITNGNNNFGSAVEFARTNTSGNDVRFASIVGVPTSNTAGSEAGDIVFKHKSTTTPNIVENVRFLADGGITFNGDTAAANALDDYEEGTWTPVFDTATSSITVTYNYQIGNYVKVGNLVLASFDVGADISSASGTAQVSVPFAASSSGAYYTSAVFRSASALGSITTGDYRAGFVDGSFINLQVLLTSGVETGIGFTTGTGKRLNGWIMYYTA